MHASLTDGFNPSYVNPLGTLTVDFKLCFCSTMLQASLTCMGARLFDPFNIVLLRAIFPLECLVLVHSGDLAIVHRIPNLLRLKRDLRVSFVAYDNVNEAVNHRFTTLYPRSGLVVMDTGTLIHCNPG
jgi:hypothetical protein